MIARGRGTAELAGAKLHGAVRYRRKSQRLEAEIEQARADAEKAFEKVSAEVRRLTRLENELREPGPPSEES